MITLKSKNLRLCLKLTVIATLSIVICWLAVSENKIVSLAPPTIALEIPSQNCANIYPQTPTHQDAVVENSGEHCLKTDFSQRNIYGAGHNWPRDDHHLIGIWSSDVTIDLMNRTLRAESASSGIVIFMNGYYGDKIFNNSAQNITIKNGVIDLRGTGTAITNLHKWKLVSLDENPPSNIHNYKITRITLDNLLIKTHNASIILEGKGNTIKNCIIESSGDSAIIMAGPQGKIINNRILLTSPFPNQYFFSGNNSAKGLIPLYESRNKNRAAIALHNATGTVISGNHIEVEHKASTRHNIYLKDESIDVQVEDNTFVGTESPVTLAKGSTAVLKNNSVEQRKQGWNFRIGFTSGHTAAEIRRRMNPILR